METTEPTSTPVKQEKPMSMNDMKSVLHDYHVPMSDGSLQKLLGESEGLVGDKANAFVEHVKMTAQGLFPTLATQIKAGIPTAVLLDPYRQVGKQILGEQFEPDFIGDTRHAQAIQGSIDPATSRPAPMNLNKWGQYLRTEPTLGWHSTPDGQRRIQKIVDAIHEGFSQGEVK